MRDVASIAASIRSVRRAAGITQEDLAHLAGTSVPTVRAIETATGNTSVRAVIAVSNVLDLRLLVRSAAWRRARVALRPPRTGRREPGA